MHRLCEIMTAECAAARKAGAENGPKVDDGMKPKVDTQFHRMWLKESDAALNRTKRR